MPTSLTRGATVLNAHIALSEYTAEQPNGTIVHDILGRPSPDITDRPAGMRSGRIGLTFATSALANTARVALAQGGQWSLQCTEHPTLNMSAFAIVGSIGLTPGSTGEWVLTTGYQEFTP